jgi:hypothetical protein
MPLCCTKLLPIRSALLLIRVAHCYRLFYQVESTDQLRAMLRWLFRNDTRRWIGGPSYQCLCWASKRSHMWGKCETHCGLLLSIISSVNPRERHELALEGCIYHFHLSMASWCLKNVTSTLKCLTSETVSLKTDYSSFLWIWPSDSMQS